MALHCATEITGLVLLVLLLLTSFGGSIVLESHSLAFAQAKTGIVVVGSGPGNKAPGSGGLGDSCSVPGGFIVFAASENREIKHRHLYRSRRTVLLACSCQCFDQTFAM
jgi:hypothetical protein